MIARKSALIVATHILNAIFGYVTLFFISKFMSPWEYGIVGFAFGFVALFQVFGNLGFESAHVKRISEGKDLGTCIGTFFTIRMGLMGFMTIIVMGAIFFWRFGLGYGFESPTHETAIYIMLVYCILSIFTNSIISTFKARKEIAKVEFPLFFEVLARTTATIFVALLGYGALALVSTYLVGWGALALSALYLFRGYPIKKPNKEYFKDYSEFAFPLIIVIACSTIITNIDKVLIQLFWSSSDVGYYFAALRLMIFVNMFTIAIGILLFPTFSLLHINNNIDAIRKLIFRSERYLSMIVFPLVFMVVALAEPTVRILLSGWMPAVSILQILTFFVLLAALEQPYQSQFLGMNQPKLARNRVIIMVFVNIILNILLIPKNIQMFGMNLAGMGARGAAIATVISYSIGLVYSRVMAWKLTAISGNPRILMHALAAAVMAVILHWLNIIAPIIRWYHLIGVIFIGVGIYFSILFLLNEFSKKDFDFFFDTLNIKKMLNYIKNEIKEK